MAGLGLGCYRFSLAWPRLQPDGRGALNEAGVDFYARLIDALLARTSSPWVTLYHWDLPQVLRGRRRLAGARHRGALRRLRRRGPTSACTTASTHWTTLNEPWVSAFIGHASGRHAPGDRRRGARCAAAHHLLLGHGLADHGDARRRATRTRPSASRST